MLLTQLNKLQLLQSPQQHASNSSCKKLHDNSSFTRTPTAAWHKRSPQSQIHISPTQPESTTPRMPHSQCSVYSSTRCTSSCLDISGLCCGAPPSPSFGICHTGFRISFGAQAHQCHRSSLATHQLPYRCKGQSSSGIS